MQVGDLVKYKNYDGHFGIVIGWNNYNRGTIPLVHWFATERILVRQSQLEVIGESR